jgi:hypothetical protein
MLLFLSGCEPVCDGALVLYHVLELYGGMGARETGEDKLESLALWEFGTPSS